MIGARAASTIRKAEQDICGLIAEAAAGGEYELVAHLSGIARRMAEMAGQAGEAIPPAGAVTPVVAVEARAKPAPAEGRRTSRKAGYPRFEKTRDVLVKIGWSKKQRSEYVHKSPKTGVDAVARRVMELGEGGRRFTTEELMPVKLSGGRDELPGYQAYVSLAWLREIGAVEQHGREGYSVCGNDIVGTVSRCWETLPASHR